MKEISEEQFQKELDTIEKKYAGKTIMANFFQLGRLEGKAFSREAKKDLRKGVAVPVECSHFVTINRQWANCGKLYEIDEAATEQFHEDLDAHKKNLAKRDKIQKMGADKLAKAILDSTEEAEEEETPGFKKRNQLYGVDKKNVLQENVGTEEGQVSPDDCVFTGTKKECNKYIKDNKDNKDNK